MVQYVSTVGQQTRKHLCNSYWMLGAELGDKVLKLTVSDLKAALSEGKFYFRKTESKTRLMKLYYRMHRGLPSYDHWTTTQLQQHFKARGLGVYAERVTKAYLVEVLEESDENVKFSKIMDLPPELRLRIYTMHFNSFSELPTGPHQPPICLVSSQIRKETLPLFYTSLTFKLELKAVNLQSIYISEWSQQFIAHTPSENLALIKNVNVRAFDNILKDPMFGEWCIRVSMARRTKKLPLVWPVRKSSHWRWPRTMVERVEETLNAAVRINPESIMKLVVTALQQRGVDYL